MKVRSIKKYFPRSVLFRQTAAGSTGFSSP